MRINLSTEPLWYCIVWRDFFQSVSGIPKVWQDFNRKNDGSHLKVKIFP